MKPLNQSCKTPLLILSDAPSATSGLGRICRDLATRLHAHCSDIFEVATLGYGGVGDKNLPFQQYAIEGMENWFIPSLPQVWQNFAGERKGAVFVIWDASRTLWLARSGNKQWNHDPMMRAWLASKPFAKWTYPAMDAAGPNGKLSVMIQECLLGYDRVIAYSKWAEDMIRASDFSAGWPELTGLTNLPHGIDTSVFKPRDRALARKVFTETLGFKGPAIKEHEKIIGIVATNQARKDWGLAMEAVSRIKDVPFRLYLQTDTLERHWSIPALLMDYGLVDRAMINTGQVTDEVMSYIYSGCDVTLGIGPEGFGYPIFESLACGTPVITGSVGGHAEHMFKDAIIQPESFRIEGVFDSVRPVFDPQDWADGILETFAWQDKPTQNVSRLPSHLRWDNLWPKWEQWFREAHRSLPPQGRIQANSSSTPETDKLLKAHRTMKAGDPAIPDSVPESSQPWQKDALDALLRDP